MDVDAVVPGVVDGSAEMPGGSIYAMACVSIRILSSRIQALSVARWARWVDEVDKVGEVGEVGGICDYFVREIESSPGMQAEKVELLDERGRVIVCECTSRTEIRTDSYISWHRPQAGREA